MIKLNIANAKQCQCSNSWERQALDKSWEKEKMKKKTNFDFKGCAAASGRPPKILIRIEIMTKPLNHRRTGQGLSISGLMGFHFHFWKSQLLIVFSSNYFKIFRHQKLIWNFANYYFLGPKALQKGKELKIW